MSSDELRIAAEDVDNWTDPTGNAHVAAQAARNLADVIEYAERIADDEWGSNWIYAMNVLDIARGETNEREKP